MLELKIILANLLRRFQFSLSDPSGPMLAPGFDMVLKPKENIFLILAKRFEWDEYHMKICNFWDLNLGNDWQNPYHFRSRDFLLVDYVYDNTVIFIKYKSMQYFLNSFFES